MSIATFREAQSNRLGIALMCLTMLVFATQDALSKHLVSRYDVFVVTAIRYWFMALLATMLAARHMGGLRATVRSARPALQIGRGLLLASQICVMVTAFVLLGLIETHAIFASAPLLVTALAGPLLGEKLGWDRWAAVVIGFLGVLVILQPGFGVFRPAALIAVVACVVFASYVLLTRVVARFDDAATSFFWTGVVGLVVLTPIGLWRWEWMTPLDGALMALLCVLSGTGHFLLIRVYAVSEANAVQPFTYLQLVFATVIAVTVLGETLAPNVAIGAAIVVSAGLFSLWRQSLG